MAASRLQRRDIRGGQTTDIEGAGKVDIDHAHEIGEWMRPLTAGDLAADADAGDIHNDARNTQFFFHRGHGRGNAVGIGDIHPDREPTHLIGDGFSQPLVQIQHRHFRAPGRQCPDGTGAEAGGTAGNDGNLIFNLHPDLLTVNYL